MYAAKGLVDVKRITKQGWKNAFTEERRGSCLRFRDNLDEEAVRAIGGDALVAIWKEATTEVMKEMPLGSTVLDFAFYLHNEEIGPRVLNAYVKGEQVPLTYHVHDLDSVELILADSSVVSPDWLDPEIVVTTYAARHIRRALRALPREEVIASGREMFKPAFKKYHLTGELFTKFAPPFLIKRVLQRFSNKVAGMNFENLDDIFYAVALHMISTEDAENIVVSEYNKVLASPRFKRGVILTIVIPFTPPLKKLQVAQVNGMLADIREIQGVIECQFSPWRRTARIRIQAEDRVGLLRDVAALISSAGINIDKIFLRGEEEDKSLIVRIRRWSRELKRDIFSRFRK